VAVVAELQQTMVFLFLCETVTVAVVAAAALVKTKQQRVEPHLLRDKVLLAAVVIEQPVLAAVVHQKPAKQMPLDTGAMAKQVQLLELALPGLAVAVAAAEIIYRSH
jgi:hypothetical protein